MVLARVANYLTNGDASSNPSTASRRHDAATMAEVGAPAADTLAGAAADEVDHEAARPPYLHVRTPGETDAEALN